MRRMHVCSDESMLKNLWIQRLPRQAQVTMNVVKGSLDEIAAVADLLVETLRISGTANSATVAQRQREVNFASSANASSEPTIAALMNSINEFSARFERSRMRDRSQSRRRERNRTPKNRNENSEICWYHREFGTRAIKCSINADPPRPCKWTTR